MNIAVCDDDPIHIKSINSALPDLEMDIYTNPILFLETVRGGKEYNVVFLESALDPLVEYDIFSKFIGMTKGNTSIIISHRVGLCKLADRIIVVNEQLKLSGLFK